MLGITYCGFQTSTALCLNKMLQFIIAGRKNDIQDDNEPTVVLVAMHAQNGAFVDFKSADVFPRSCTRPHADLKIKQSGFRVLKKSGFRAVNAEQEGNAPCQTSKT
jgi:hypothetical protein